MSIALTAPPLVPISSYSSPRPKSFPIVTVAVDFHYPLSEAQILSHTLHTVKKWRILRWRLWQDLPNGKSRASGRRHPSKDPTLLKSVFGTGICRWRGTGRRTSGFTPNRLGFRKSSLRSPGSSYGSPPPAPIADPLFLRYMRDYFGQVTTLLALLISTFKGGEGNSIWPTDGTLQHQSTQSTLRCLSRMLNEGIHADVTIITSDGSLKAHKSILSTSSPVFHSMFQLDLREKESSTVEIEDMTAESCMALLSYLYGTINQEDFWRHRLALLCAANKYDIVDLKDACEESLLEDINSSNVLERLQEAWLYQLDKLKKGCLMYLLDFGKIYDVREEMNEFFRQADRELVVEMFQEVLAVWKPT